MKKLHPIDPKWTQTGLRFHFGVKFHSVWGNFIISVHMASGGVKLTSEHVYMRPEVNSNRFEISFR